MILQDEQFNRYLRFITADGTITDGGGDRPPEGFYITQEDGFLIELEDSSGYLLQEIAP